MIPPEPTAPDRPFPGARSQVRHAFGEADASAPGTARTASLPLDARSERSAQGWVVRLRVRAEHVTVSKEVVISERVVLKRNVVDDVEHAEAVIHREQLRVETEGSFEVTHVGNAPSRPDSDRLAARQGLPWRGDEHSLSARPARAADQSEDV
jgi:hypothetical protein